MRRFEHQLAGAEKMQLKRSEKRNLSRVPSGFAAAGFLVLGEVSRGPRRI
jgi:hypothetical protein